MTRFTPHARAEKPTTAEQLPRNVVVLSWVSFFQDAASEMLYPVMPLFLTSVLGAPVVVVGLVEGLGEAVVDPGRWPVLMEEICSAVGTTGAALLQSDIRTPDVR